MKLLCFLSIFAAVMPVFAQTPTAAEAELSRLKELVAVGAVAPARVREAEAVVADARDEEVLKRTLYARLSVEEFSEEQANDMLAAAQRLIDRQQARVQHEQDLIEAGVTGKIGVAGAKQDLANRRKTLELAKDRARLIEEIAQMAQAEAAAEVAGSAAQASSSQSMVSDEIAERFDGNGSMLTARNIRELTLAFEKEFSHPMPVSARGETAVHRALGFDHRGRIDIAVEPDGTEGKWLRLYLAERGIPFYAFRAAVARKATAPHIHVGPGSVRIRSSD